MKNVLPALLKDCYKIGHAAQYPKDSTMVYSNFTPRSSRIADTKEIVAFGYQFFVLEYLIRQWNENFFAIPKAEVLRQYQRRVDGMLGPGTDISHIAALHDLGYLPLAIKAVPEGTLVPLRVPVLTIRNTKPEFFWLTNMVETLMSNVLWMASTSATIAFQYRRTFEKYANETGAPKEFVPWQGHDFSFRGMSGVEAACLSGAGHLLSFTGTDTIPAIDFLENYYGADCEKELIGGSVPATEHSVMCMGAKEGERETIKRLITEVYPKGIVSIVCDTWDFWKVLIDILPSLRSTILAREGKLVVRPDSGDPVKIICGDESSDVAHVHAGAIETLYSVFGGVSNGAGYRELDPHIGLIYGDSITRERQGAILEGLKAKGFASSNVVLGIGSYTYQFNTRDTFGWAMKATYGETKRGPQNIFKDPKTDDGTKKSAVGLLCVRQGQPLEVIEKCSWNLEEQGLLQPIFIDGRHHNFQHLSRIRKRIEEQL